MGMIRDIWLWTWWVDCELVDVTMFLGSMDWGIVNGHGKGTTLVIGLLWAQQPLRNTTTLGMGRGQAFVLQIKKRDTYSTISHGIVFYFKKLD